MLGKDIDVKVDGVDVDVGVVHSCTIFLCCLNMNMNNKDHRVGQLTDDNDDDNDDDGDGSASHLCTAPLSPLTAPHFNGDPSSDQRLPEMRMIFDSMMMMTTGKWCCC